MSTYRFVIYIALKFSFWSRGFVVPM